MSRIKRKTTLEPLPNFGDLIPIDDFIESVKNNSFIDYDGYGYFATEKGMESDEFYPSELVKNKYNIKVDKYHYKSSYLVFYINRRLDETAVNHNEIEFSENINRFILTSIVIYKNQNYTLYTIFKNEWYYYNDLKGIKKIGSYEEMLEHKPNPQRNGVLFFYQEIM